MYDVRDLSSKIRMKLVQAFELFDFEKEVKHLIDDEYHRKHILHLLTFQTPILYILFENYIKLFLGIK
jgi:hypothetical protein